MKEFTRIARNAAVLNSAIICRVLRLKEGMADARIQHNTANKEGKEAITNVKKLSSRPVVLLLRRKRNRILFTLLEKRRRTQDKKGIAAQ